MTNLKKYLQYTNLDPILLKDIQDAIIELQSLSSKVSELNAKCMFEKSLSDFFAKTITESDLIPSTHPVMLLYNKARKEQFIAQINDQDSYHD